MNMSFRRWRDCGISPVQRAWIFQQGDLYLDLYDPSAGICHPCRIDWAVQEATTKKKKDFSKVEFFTYDEGLCVQCMHIGSYDTEPGTLRQLDAFAAEQGYCPDFSDTRFHHEIYLGDPRRTAPEKLKTVLRHPIRRMK